MILGLTYKILRPRWMGYPVFDSKAKALGSASASGSGSGFRWRALTNAPRSRWPDIRRNPFSTSNSENDSQRDACSVSVRKRVTCPSLRRVLRNEFTTALVLNKLTPHSLPQSRHIRATGPVSFTNDICGLASADASLECGGNRSMKFAGITGRFVTPQDHFFAATIRCSLPDVRCLTRGRIISSRLPSI